MAEYATVCDDCLRVFLGGPNAFLCPECRRKRQSESAKKRNLNKLGNEAKSKKQAEKKAREQAIPERFRKYMHK